MLFGNGEDLPGIPSRHVSAEGFEEGPVPDPFFVQLRRRFQTAVKKNFFVEMIVNIFYYMSKLVKSRSFLFVIQSVKLVFVDGAENFRNKSLYNEFKSEISVIKCRTDTKNGRKYFSKNTIFILFMQVMNGTFLQGVKYQKKIDTMVTFN